jgi:hypothetical protein
MSIFRNDGAALSYSLFFARQAAFVRRACIISQDLLLAYNVISFAFVAAPATTQFKRLRTMMRPTPNLIIPNLGTFDDGGIARF